MAETLFVQPDSNFIDRLMVSGAPDVKKCFQCATCSSVCSLSHDGLAFPRKQMLMAQWGLKDRLFKDPGIWLCHHCGDCDYYCPRGANPAEVMGALRNQAIQRYAFPRTMGALLSRQRYLPLVIAIPAVILGALWWASSHLGLASGSYAGQFPRPDLIGLFVAAAVLLVVVTSVSLRRMAADLRKGGADNKILRSLIPSMIGMVSDGRIAKCQTGQKRFWGHMALAAGFAGLTVSGVADLAGVGLYSSAWGSAARAPLHWGLYMGFLNLSALLALGGLATILRDHFLDSEHTAHTTYFDWLFLLNLTGVAVSWVLTEAFMLAGVAVAASICYYTHLVLVLGLFLYAPYSKFAHVLYRIVAHAAVPAESPQSVRKPLADGTLTCTG